VVPTAVVAVNGEKLVNPVSGKGMDDPNLQDAGHPGLDWDL